MEIMYNANADKCVKGLLDDKSKQECPGGYAWRCNHTGLTDVPTNYPNYNASSKLCLLDLSWNHLSLIPNNSFSADSLSDVLWIWLYQNQLKRVDAGAFVGLSRLVYMNLSSNFLEYPKSFGNGVFKPLIHLENLNLKNNSIKSFDGLDDLLAPLNRSLSGLLITGCYNCTFGKGFENLSSLKKLTLSGVLRSDNTLCNISTLHNDTFVHVPQLQELYLEFCNIEYVAPMAFTPLKSIEILDISYNTQLTFKGMYSVLTGLAYSPILLLDFSHIHEFFERGTILKEKYMAPIRNLHSLTVLYMELNKLEVIEEDVFDLIPCSTSHFSLSGNRLTYGVYVQKVSNMKNIVYLDLARQHLNYDPFLQKHQERLSVWNRLKLDSGFSEARSIRDQIELDFSGKHYTYLKTYKSNNSFRNNTTKINLSPMEGCKGIHEKSDCEREDVCSENITCIFAPRNLKHLIWRQSFLYFHILALRVCQPSSLEFIDLSFNLIEKWIGPVYGLEGLDNLNLAENVCQYISQNFFDNMYSLRTLNVSFNFLGPMLIPGTTQSGTYFKNLTQLQTLDLSENRIHGLSVEIFQNLTSLRVLNVSKNMLTQWNSTLTSNCLALIDMSDNKLESITESFRNYFDHLASLSSDSSCGRRNVTLDLSGNPIQCNCDNRPFLRWLSRSNVNILFYETDECHLQDGKRLQLWNADVIPDFVNHLDIVCFPFIFICVSLGIFLISICMCIALYCNRWKLRHLYYSKRRRHHNEGYDRLFERDAFISYAQTECGFIKNKLVPALEDEGNGLNVWVADRDSTAGASIAENLTHAIYTSKKTVLIFSRRYFVESWCNYEMNMARVESVESKRKLFIIVMYEDIPAKEIPLDYLRLLKSVQPIEYPKHPQHLDTFWASLTAAIQEEWNKSDNEHMPRLGNILAIKL